MVSVPGAETHGISVARESTPSVSLRAFLLTFICILSPACAKELSPREHAERLRSAATTEEIPLSECPTTRAAEDPPVAVFRRDAYFPIEAMHRAHELSARVWLEYSIGRDGRTSEVVILQYKGSNVFNRPATLAVMSWEFCPVPEGEPAYEGRYQAQFRYSPSASPGRVTPVY